MPFCVKDSIMGLVYVDWILGEGKNLCLYKTCEKMTLFYVLMNTSLSVW